MSLPSVMTHEFSKIPPPTIQRSTFNRSHGLKTAFDAGYLVPIYVDEALPSDTFSMKVHLMARLSTLVKPVMDNLWLETFFFAVPCRLLWANWKRFMGEQSNPGDSTSYVIPQVFKTGAWTEGSIFDYFGLPTDHTKTTGTFTANALPLRAYNLIYNEWFRDENLCTAATIANGDIDSPGNYALLKRGKRHDYFTSCLPWAQKGVAISMPIGGNAAVWGTDYAMGFRNTTQNDLGMYTQAGVNGAVMLAKQHVAGIGVGIDISNNTTYPNNAQDLRAMGYIRKQDGIAQSGLYADLAGATAATINDIRLAFQLQKMLERDARGGTRYAEILRAHFGVMPEDARMQRPEYLGGSSCKISINAVQQTSASVSGQTPQGNLSAYVTAHDSNGVFHRSFNEHCIIIGLANVRSDITYQQGINRMWSRTHREDFYWPELAHIGEQAVFNREIYSDGTSNDSGVFGYQERFAEYRYHPSMITGILRSTSTLSLEVWHNSQNFAALPTLNQTFIEDKTNEVLVRNIAVTNQPQIILDAYFDLKCARPMPVYSVPGYIDHF